MAERRDDPYREFADEAELAIRTLITGIGQIIWWLVRHPRISLPLAGIGWIAGTASIAAAFSATCIVLIVLLLWRLFHRRSFNRAMGNRLRIWWRYKRRWHGVAAQSRLAIRRGETEMVPKIRSGRITPTSDELTLSLIPGQTPEDIEKAAPALAHAFGAKAAHVRVTGPGRVRLSFTMRDPLAAVVPPMRIPDEPDLERVPIGIREDGSAWELRIAGTHVLIAGVTGSGKGSVLWSTLAGISPAISDGSVEVWAIDPKGGMELGIGAPLFSRFQAADPEGAAELLEDAVVRMKERAARLAGSVRRHQATPDDPLLLIVIDEVANLTAYLPDRKLKARISDALALLLTQGRAVGVSVIAALQDPRKEVIALRNLFPTRIALRLDEPAQVDMVLGEGARLAGARCDQIPAHLPGVGYVRIDGVREPARVRAAYLGDRDVSRVAETRSV